MEVPLSSSCQCEPRVARRGNRLLRRTDVAARRDARYRRGWLRALARPRADMDGGGVAIACSGAQMWLRGAMPALTQCSKR